MKIHFLSVIFDNIIKYYQEKNKGKKQCSKKILDNDYINILIKKVFLDDLRISFSQYILQDI